MRVVVIGGGPAGMMAAITAASKIENKEKNKVILIEKMDKLGKKLLITGKGRCNITSNIDIEEFIKNIPGNGKFLYSAFKNFSNKDIVNLLKKEGLDVKVERGNRIFPVTDKSSDVLKVFLKLLEKENVEILTKTKVSKILTKDDKVIGVIANDKKIEAEKVIIATGGKSYPLTGSNGDGYTLAESLGHKLIEAKPSLVPLTSKGESLKYCQMMQGLSLKNINIKVLVDGKNIYEDFGEMLFTHFGISGPVILSASAHLIRKNFKDAKISIDLKPGLTEEKLDERILRDFSNEKNKEFKNSLDKLLPKKMIPVILEMMKINKKVNEITKEERKKLVKILKDFRIEISGFRPIEEAIVTAGGINTKEINPKTMESKLWKGLYFAGEVIDVDAYTGGFNLQIAYSTGYTAGLN